jgi:hypothetical protein
MGSYVLEKLADRYPKKLVQTYSVFPNQVSQQNLISKALLNLNLSTEIYFEGKFWRRNLGRCHSEEKCEKGEENVVRVKIRKKKGAERK